MQRCERKITKEQFDRAQQNRGYIANVDRPDIFNVSELCGYGVYSPLAFERDGEYYVSYLLGESCD